MIEMLENLETLAGPGSVPFDPVVLHSPFNIAKMQFPASKPFVLDGKHQLVFKEGLTIMDCHNIEIRNCIIFGGVNLNDSYPEIGLKNITIRGCRILHSPSRGIFMGGKNIQGINIIDNVVLYVQGIYNTHGIYLTGAHWGGSDWGPVKKVKIVGNVVGYNPGGRNAVQLNGRFFDVEIANNVLFHFQNEAISLKGVQKCTIVGNEVYGGNRGKGVVVHDYIWPGWEPKLFKKYHQPCREIYTGHNTFVVGPKQFSSDPFHGDDPTDGHPVFEVVNHVHADPAFAPYENASILFMKNAIWTPNPKILQIAHEHEATVTTFVENLVACASSKEPYIDFADKLQWFEKGWLADPDKMFLNGLPQYPDSIDLEADPYYDFMQHESSFNSFSAPAKKHGVGKKHPVVVHGPGFRHPFWEEIF